MRENTLEHEAKQVADTIKRLLDEDPVFHPLKGDSDGRSAIRREFVRAVKVEFENQTSAEGYCANISTHGIELITQQMFPVNSKAIIEIQSVRVNESYRFVAECRWAEDHDVGGILSGWSFLREISPNDSAPN